MKILIIGGGIGGLGLAGFLEREQIADYRLIEKDTDWLRHGFTLGMWSNGRAMLAKLGLADNFDRNIIPYQRMVVKTGAGRLIKSYNLSNFYIDYGLGYSHLHRQDLHNWLLSKVDQQKLRMGTTASRIANSDKGVEVVFSDGSKDVFDLVVGADGVKSEIRNKNFGDHFEKYIDWRVWYVLPKQRLAEPHSVTEYLDPNRFIGLFDDGEKSLVILCAKISHSIYDQEKGRIERLRSLFNEPLVQQALRDLSDAEVLPTDLAEINLNKWHKDRLVLIGDAAHAFEPFAGLGASMALEDAYVLSEELCKIKKDYSLDSALLSYELRRRGRVGRAAWLTKKMKAWATVESSFLRRLINAFAGFIPANYFVKDFIKLMNENI